MDLSLAAYDLSPPLILAAFLGSLVYIAAQDGPPKGFWTVFSPIVAGTITGNYLPHLIISYFLGETVASGLGGASAACLTGALGPLGARMLIKKAKAWTLSTNGRGTT